MSKVKVGIDCPRCGTFIVIRGIAEEVQYKPKPDIEKAVLERFTPSIQKILDVKIDGSHAIITMTGAFDKKKFKKIASEVTGYGGRWIKGHFILPLAGLGETN